SRVLNQGPFPPPALPGFVGTTGLSATPARPGLSLAGVRSVVTRHRRGGLPVLHRISVCRHAVPCTPVDSLGPIARGPAYSSRSPAAGDAGLPQDTDGSAPTT